MNEDFLKLIYQDNGLSKKGSFEEFKNDMNDPEIRKFIHETYYSQKGSFEEFNADLGVKEPVKKETPVYKSNKDNFNKSLNIDRVETQIEDEVDGGFFDRIGDMLGSAINSTFGGVKGLGKNVEKEAIRNTTIRVKKDQFRNDNPVENELKAINYKDAFDHFGENNDDVDEIHTQSMLLINRNDKRMREVLKDKAKKLSPESQKVADYVAVNGILPDPEYIPEDFQSLISLAGQIAEQKKINDYEFAINIKEIRKELDKEMQIAKDNDLDPRDAAINVLSKYPSMKNTIDMVELNKKAEKEMGEVTPQDRDWAETAAYNTMDKVFNGITYLAEGIADIIDDDEKTTLNAESVKELNDFLHKEAVNLVKDNTFGKNKSKYQRRVSDVTVDVDGKRLIVDKGKVVGIIKPDGNNQFDFFQKDLEVIDKYEANPKAYSDKLERNVNWGSIGAQSTQVVSDMMPMLAASIATGGGAGGVMLGSALTTFPAYYEEEFQRSGDHTKALGFGLASTAVISFIESKIGSVESKAGRTLSEITKKGLRDEVRDVLAREFADQSLKGSLKAASSGISAKVYSAAINKLKTIGGDLGGEIVEEMSNFPAEALVNAAFGNQYNVSEDDVLETLILTPIASAPMSVLANIFDSRDLSKDLINAARFQDKFTEMLSKSKDPNQALKTKIVKNFGNVYNALEELEVEPKLYKGVLDKATDLAKLQFKIETSKSPITAAELQKQATALETEINDDISSLKSTKTQPNPKSENPNPDPAKVKNQDIENLIFTTPSTEEVVPSTPVVEESSTKTDTGFNNSTDRSQFIGMSVNYQGIDGVLVQTDYGYGVETDGEIIPLEGGSSTSPNSELGLLINPDSAVLTPEPVLSEQDTADPGAIAYDDKTKTVTAYGKKFEIVKPRYGEDGDITSLTVRDDKGSTRTIRNPEILALLPEPVRKVDSEQLIQSTTDPGSGYTATDTTEYEIAVDKEELTDLENELSDMAELVAEEIRTNPKFRDQENDFTKPFDEGIASDRELRGNPGKKFNAAAVARAVLDGKVPKAVREILGDTTIEELKTKAKRWRELSSKTTPTQNRNKRVEAARTDFENKRKAAMERMYPGIGERIRVLSETIAKVSRSVKGTAIVLAESPEEFKRITGFGITTGGVYDQVNDVIYINPGSASAKTVVHEAAHAVFSKLFGNGSRDAVLLHETISRVLKQGDEAEKAIAKKLDQFISQYGVEDITEYDRRVGNTVANIRADEFFSELMGLLVTEGIKIKKPRIKKILELLNNIIQQFTGLTYFKPTDTVNDLVDFVNAISGGLSRGIDIESILKNEGGRFTNEAKPISASDFRQSKENSGKVFPKMVVENTHFGHIATVDIDNLLTNFEKENGRAARVWFWQTDWLKRGDYYNPETGYSHFVEGGIGYAFDKDHMEKNKVWACNNAWRYKKAFEGSDFVFMVAMSPNSSMDFSKGVSHVLVKNAMIKTGMSDKKLFAQVKKAASVSNNKEVQALFKAMGPYKDFETFLDEKSGRDRKLIMGAIHSGLTKISNDFYKTLHDKLGFETRQELNEKLHEPFFKLNNFQFGDVAAVLKMDSFGLDESDHASYRDEIYGEVVGIPTEKYNVVDLIPDRLRTDYSGKEITGKPQLMKKIIPDGGFNTVQASEVLNKIQSFRREIVGERAAKNLNYSVIYEGRTMIENLDVAKSMSEKGIDSDKIFLATGWEKGRDQQWRYDLPSGDFTADFKSDTEGWKNSLGTGFVGTYIGNIYYNYELFRAYPEIAEVNITFSNSVNDNKNSLNRGIFMPDANLIWLNPNLDLKQMKATLLHEIQHVIQKLEGFEGQGTNVTQVLNKLNPNEVAKLRTAALAEITEFLQDLRNDKSGFENALEFADSDPALVNELISQFRYENTTIGKIVDLFKPGNSKAVKKYHNTGYGENLPLILLQRAEDADSYKTYADYLLSKTEEDIQEYEKLLAEFETADLTKDLIEKSPVAFNTLFDIYMKEAGEVEARNAAFRDNLSFIRDTTPMSQTEDVARDEQILIQDLYDYVLEITGNQQSNYRQSKSYEFDREKIEYVKSIPYAEGDGTTFDLDGTVYDGGGLVLPIGSKNVDVSELNSEAIEDFIRTILPTDVDTAAVKPGLYKIPNSNLISIDLNIITGHDRLDEALAFARYLGQESLFDLTNFKNIPTGETGLNPRTLTAQEIKDAIIKFSPSSFRESKIGKDAIPYMTEDSEGNYVFFHYSSKKLSVLDPGQFGKNPITSREESSALSGAEAVFFYTVPDFAEPGVGSVQHQVKIAKDKVYDATKDPLNFYDEAEARFRERWGKDRAFTPNSQIAWVTKVASENGYPVSIARWSGVIGSGDYLRAQSVEKLKPESVNAEYTRTKAKTKFSKKEVNSDLEDLKSELYNYAMSKPFGPLHELAYELEKMTPAEIVNAVLNSKFPKKLKDKTVEATNASFRKSKHQVGRQTVIDNIKNNIKTIKSRFADPEEFYNSMRDKLLDNGITLMDLKKLYLNEDPNKTIGDYIAEANAAKTKAVDVMTRAGLSQDQVKANLAIFEEVAGKWAKTTGRTADEFFTDVFAGFEFVPDPNELKQGGDNILYSAENVRKSIWRKLIDTLPFNLSRKFARLLDGSNTETSTPYEEDALLENTPGGIQFKNENKEVIRGARKILSDGRAMIYLTSDATVSTPVHELAHIYEMFMPEQDRETVMNWAGHKTWNVSTSEMFARGFEQFLSEGHSFKENIEMSQVFAKFKEWMKSIINGIMRLGGRPIILNNTIRDIYTRMFDSEFELNKDTDFVKKIDEFYNDIDKGIGFTKEVFDRIVSANFVNPSVVYNNTSIQRIITNVLNRGLNEPGKALEIALQALIRVEQDRERGGNGDPMITVEEYMGMSDAALALEGQVLALEQRIQTVMSQGGDVRPFEEQLINLREDLGNISSVLSLYRSTAGLALGLGGHMMNSAQFSPERMDAEIARIEAIRAKNSLRPLTETEKKQIYDSAKKLRTMSAELRKLQSMETETARNQRAAAVDKHLSSIWKIPVFSAILKDLKGFSPQQMDERYQAGMSLLKKYYGVDSETLYDAASDEAARLFAIYNVMAVKSLKNPGLNNVADITAALQVDLPGLTENDVVNAVMNIVGPDPAQVQQKVRQSIAHIKEEAKLIDKLSKMIDGTLQYVQKPPNQADATKQVQDLKEVMKAIEHLIAKGSYLSSDTDFMHAVTLLNNLEANYVDLMIGNKRPGDINADDVAEMARVLDAFKQARLRTTYEKKLEDLENDISKINDLFLNGRGGTQEMQDLYADLAMKYYIGSDNHKSLIDPEIASLKNKLNQGRNDLYALLKRKTESKISTFLKEFLNTPRLLILAADWSFIFYQGGLLTIKGLLTNPLRTVNNIYNSLYSSFSQTRFDKISENLVNHPQFFEAQTAGLNLSGLAGSVLEEELNIKSVLERVPFLGSVVTGIRNFSERGYVSYMASVRLQAYERMTRGVTSPQALEELAEHINTVTGAGRKFGFTEEQNRAFDTMLQGAATTFIAPRLYASVFKSMYGMSFGYASDGVALARAKDPDLKRALRRKMGNNMLLLAGQGLMVATMYALTKAFGEDGDEEDMFDIFSSQFMKAKFGQTVMALSPFASYARFLGKYSAKMYEWYTGEKLTKDREWQKKGLYDIVVNDFLENRLNPFLTSVSSLVFNRDYRGKAIPEETQFNDRYFAAMAPIPMQGVVDNVVLGEYENIPFELVADMFGFNSYTVDSFNSSKVKSALEKVDYDYRPDYPRWMDSQRKRINKALSRDEENPDLKRDLSADDAVREEFRTVVKQELGNAIEEALSKGEVVTKARIKKMQNVIEKQVGARLAKEKGQ